MKAAPSKKPRKPTAAKGAKISDHQLALMILDYFAREDIKKRQARIHKKVRAKIAANKRKATH